MTHQQQILNKLMNNFTKEQLAETLLNIETEQDREWGYSHCPICRSMINQSYAELSEIEHSEYCIFHKVFNEEEDN